MADDIVLDSWEEACDRVVNLECMRVLQSLGGDKVTVESVRVQEGDIEWSMRKVSEVVQGPTL